MLVWILILGSWVALLSLILHDATKEDSDGSAISIAAKNLKAFIFRVLQKSISKLPVQVATAVKAISSSSNPSGPTEIKQAPALPSKKKWWPKEHRVSITIPELELAISEAVAKAAPGCEDFVGVVVRHATPKSRLDPNWAIRGVKFGNADRKMANEALGAIVERMQREFLLSGD
jgi:hypothetical protein